MARAATSTFGLRFAAITFVCFSLAISPWSIKAVAETTPNVARTETELKSRLGMRTSISLSGSQIRRAAEAIARNGETSLAFDRRVDPELPVELSGVDRPVEEIWSRLAESCDLGFATFGPLVYVGTKPTARDLNTLAALRRADAERFPAALKSKLSHAAATSCAEPCEARELWNKLAGEAELTTVNPERMAFDLWPAIQWAPLTLLDRLTLVAVQFDLTFRIDPTAGTITLVPLPDVITLERTYAAGLKPQETLARFRALAPAAVIRWSGTTISVVGTWEDHQRLAGGAAANHTVAQAPGKAPDVAAPAGAQLFTLRVKDVPLGELVRVLQEKHKLKITVDEAGIEAAGLSLDGRTAVDVQKVTLERLLDQAAAPLGLGARTVGDAVEIGVRNQAPKK